jgi:hypothetical protein
LRPSSQTGAAFGLFGSTANAGCGQYYSDLFGQYDAETIFGIALVHRHFDMEPREVLAEHKSTSTPWPMPPDPQNFMGGRIVPHSWRFADASLEPQPYEFGFQRHDDIAKSVSVDPPSHAAFITDLRDTLKRHRLTSILGLVALSPDYVLTEDQSMIKCEKTFGRANGVFEVGAEALKEKDKRTSIWIFGKAAKGGRESMVCFSGCICDQRLAEDL